MKNVKKVPKEPIDDAPYLIRLHEELFHTIAKNVEEGIWESWILIKKDLAYCFTRRNGRAFKEFPAQSGIASLVL